MKLSTLAAFSSLAVSRLCLAESNFTAHPSSQQLLQGDFKPPQVCQNENRVRHTNLDRGCVRATINVVSENVAKAPQYEYYLPFEYDVISKVGGVEVRDKKNTEKGRFDTRIAAMSVPLGVDGAPTK